MNKRFAALPVVAALALFAGCQSTQGTSASSQNAAMTPDNTICPIGGHDINPEIAPVAYKGQNIGFCCEACATAWPEMSDAERDAALATLN